MLKGRSCDVDAARLTHAALSRSVDVTGWEMQKHTTYRNLCDCKSAVFHFEKWARLLEPASAGQVFDQARR